MGFMEKVGATIATKYGTVIGGKHEGTIVALGNDPGKKVETTDRFTQIIFLEGTEEKGRYDIIESFSSLDISEETDEGLKVVGTFRNGESFTLLLEWKKEDGIAKGLFKTLIGAKKVDATPEELAEKKYRPIKVFTQMFDVLLTRSAIEFLLGFYEKNNVLDEKLEEKLKRLASK